MFGPHLPIHDRERIYARRLQVALPVAAVLLLVASVVLDVMPRRELPRRASLEGPLQVAPHLDDPEKETSPVELLAGGHPIPNAIEVIEFELEAEGEEFPDRSQEGQDTPELPEIEVPDPGPAEGPGEAPRDAVRLSVRSDRFAILRFVKPTYPADAEVFGNEGRVLVHALVDREGHVVEVRAEPEDGLLPSCVEAAERATLEWRFTPVKENGVPVPFWVAIPYQFTLGGVGLGI